MAVVQTSLCMCGAPQEESWKGLCSAWRKVQFATKFPFTYVCPLLHVLLFCPFPTLKPPVRWIGGAPEPWSHLWSPRHDCHHSLCIDHPTLCGRQFWTLEYPFKEEDSAGQVGGETLFFLFKKQDLGSTYGIDLSLPSLSTKSQLWNLQPSSYFLESCWDILVLANDFQDNGFIIQL